MAIVARIPTVKTLKIIGPIRKTKGKSANLTSTVKPEGGTFKWTVVSGRGTLSTSTTAKTTVDCSTVGPVKIKLKYTLPNGRNKSVRHTITFYKLKKVKVTLPATPRKRDGTDRTAPAKSFRRKSKVFNAKALSLVKDCGKLKLRAKIDPSNTPVKWIVERASDDAASLKGLPTLTQRGASGKTQLLDTGGRATGSFHIIAYVDDDNDGKYKASDGAIITNVNLVKVKIRRGRGNNRIFKRQNRYTARRSNANNLVVDSGSSGGIVPNVNAAYTDAEFSKHAISFKATVLLTGGGANRRRGVGQIGLGYIQTTTRNTVSGTYADGKIVKEVIFSNAGLPWQVVTGAATLLAFPVRDTLGAVVSGTGPYINSSSDNHKRNVPRRGQKRIVRFVDPPAIVLPLRHPTTNSKLASISGSNFFEVFLSAYSKDFKKNYAVIGTSAWSASYGSYKDGRGWSRRGAKVRSPRSMRAFDPAKVGKKTDVERWTPNFVDNVKLDCR